MMNILIAFDKFKDSMTATLAGDAAEAGIRSALSGTAAVRHAPLTDGGEGFCRILVESADGYIEYHPVTGPLGEEVDAPLGWVETKNLSEKTAELLGGARGRIAIIEMASVAGLEQVPLTSRHPAHCTTRGVGELIRIAVAGQADAILLGVGGSASSDLGLGALESLGLGIEGAPNSLPMNWTKITGFSGAPDLKAPPVFIACDVDNPLLGPRGAAAVYGPQKGLKEAEISAFDAGAKRMAARLCDYFGTPLAMIHTPGCGAAGGIGFGLKLALGANFVPGFQLVEAWLDLPGKVAWADCILTGEGKFDLSSLSGKGPFALLAAARNTNKPAFLLAGAIDPEARTALAEKFPQIKAYSISPPAMPLDEALTRGPENLELQVHTALAQAAKK